MKKYISSSLIFIILNFIGLAIGGLWTNSGVISDWYLNLNQAPWTPPGWVFGAAWTTIGLTFGIAVSKLQVEKDWDMMLFYYLSWLINLSWNAIFFGFKSPLLGLILIIDLSVLIGIITHNLRLRHGKWFLFSLPYFLWLMIATSLNMFIVLTN